jgi:hypothetical protein
LISLAPQLVGIAIPKPNTSSAPINAFAIFDLCRAMLVGFNDAPRPVFI